ncbi:MAG: AtpZ/AtpI family protein [Bdellovibrionales bacterium]
MGADSEHHGLDDLEARIRAAESRNEPEKPTEESVRPLRASRLGTDFVAALLGCMGIGWLIGEAFPSLHPWALVAMVPVGFAVGALNIWRAIAGGSGIFRAEDGEREGSEDTKGRQKD